VQGAHDEYVPPRQILKLSESLGGPNSVAWLPDADHHFSKPEDFQLMTTLLSNWVADHLNGPTPPSQLDRKLAPAIPSFQLVTITSFPFHRSSLYAFDS